MQRNRVLGFLIGAAAALLLDTLICGVMAAAHSATRGMGDGSLADTMVLMLVILLIPIGAVAGAIIGVPE